MNASFSDYIEKNYIAEMQEVINKAVSLFDRLNIATYETYILNLLNESENQDSEFLSTHIVSYIEGFVIGLEKEFGFSLSDQITLEQRVDFVRSYVDLEDYIDHEAVIRVLETDDDPAEQLSEVVALVSTTSKDVLCGFIDSVDESSLLTLKRFHLNETPEEELAEEISGPIASAEQVMQVRAYIAFLKTHNLSLHCVSLIYSGYEIGLPLSIYWEQVGGLILQLDRASICRELLGLYLFSKEHWANPHLAFMEFNEQHLDNLHDVTETNTLVKGLLSSFLAFKHTNRIK